MILRYVAAPVLSPSCVMLVGVQVGARCAELGRANGQGGRGRGRAGRGVPYRPPHYDNRIPGYSRPGGPWEQPGPHAPGPLRGDMMRPPPRPFHPGQRDRNFGEHDDRDGTGTVFGRRGGRGGRFSMGGMGGRGWGDGAGRRPDISSRLGFLHDPERDGPEPMEEHAGMVRH